MVQQADGKLVVLARVSNGIDNDIVVFRLNNDATLSLDASFAPPSGYAYFEAGGGAMANDVPRAMVRQADGKLVVAGYRDDGLGGQKDVFVIRVEASGLSLDATFGASGIFTANLGGGSNDDVLNDVILHGTNIVAAGYYAVSSASDFLFIRLTSAGVLDITFSGDGISGYNTGTLDRFNAIALSGFGMYVAGGSTTGGTDSAVMGVDFAGFLNFYYANNFGGTDYVNSIVIDGSNNIIAGGTADDDLLVFRLTSAGVLDTTFSAEGTGTDGWNIIPIWGYGGGVATDIINSLALQTDGKIVFAGVGSLITGRLIGVERTITVTGSDTSVTNPGVIASISGSGTGGTAISDVWNSFWDWWNIPNNATTTATVDDGAGPYTLSSTGNAGYSVTFGGACNSTTGNGTGTATCTINAPISVNKAITVAYAPIPYTLTANGTGNGSGVSVVSSLGGISFAYNPGAGTDSEGFTVETVLNTLTATAAAGSIVTAVTGCPGALSAVPAVVVTCDVPAGTTGNQTVTFTFTTYTVTANATGTGSGTVSSTLPTIGYAYPAFSTDSELTDGLTAVTHTATANAGSTVAWSGDCNSTTGNGTGVATCTINSPFAVNKTSLATFTPITYNLTVNINPSGSVTGSGTGWAYGPTSTSGATTFNITNLNLTLVATPAAGYQNASWAGCDAGNGTATCTVSSIGDRTVTVSFTLITYNLTVNIGANGSASGTGAGWTLGLTPGPATVIPTFNITNLNLTLTAVPNAGYTASWAGCNAGNGTATCTVNSIGDRTVTATFTLEPRPDLVVDWSREYVRDRGGMTYVSAFLTVTNIGTAASPSATVTFYEVAPGPIESVLYSFPFGGLAIGESKTNYFKFLVTTGNTVRAKADAALVVPELNEGNNSDDITTP